MNILEILEQYNCSAVIFDLDGTILDNNPYHLESWKEYLKQIGREMTDEEFNEKLNGRTNRDVVRYLYGDDLSEEEIWQHTNEKESLYRQMYKPHITAVPGLVEMLDILFKHNIPMAIATSGIKVNIDFMFDNVPIRKYFKAVVDSSCITQGKPHPEIFLKAAESLGVDPAECLVFEDAVVGIEASQAAGMKVIAVQTTESRENLSVANLIVNDYRELI